jgi:hypothetical protein
MENIELRANAMLAEVVGQRNSALDRCVSLQADIAMLKARIEELEKARQA